MQALKAAQDAGFVVVRHEDIAHHPSCEVKWYATLKSGKLLHRLRDYALSAAEFVRLVPAATPNSCTVSWFEFHGANRYPRVATWLDAMRALPDFDAAHSILQVYYLLLSALFFGSLQLLLAQYPLGIAAFTLAPQISTSFRHSSSASLFRSPSPALTMFSQRVAKKNLDRTTAASSKL